MESWTFSPHKLRKLCPISASLAAGKWEMACGQPTLSLLGWAVALCWITATNNANIPKNCLNIMKHYYWNCSIPNCPLRLQVWEHFLTRCPSTGQLKHLHSQKDHGTMQLSSWHPAFFRQTCQITVFFKENMSSWRCSFLLCLGHSSHLCPSSSSWKQAGDYNTSVLTWTWEASATCVMNLILRHQSTCMLRLVAFASNIIDVHCTAFTSHCKLYSNLEKVRVISDMFSFQNTNALHPSLSISPSPLSLVETSTYPQTKQQSRPSCLIKVFNHCMVYIIINAYKWHIHHQSVCFLKFCLVG